MDLNLLLEMAVSGYGERAAVASERGTLTYEELAKAAAAGASLMRRMGAEAVVYLGPSHPAFPVALFAAAAAGVPFVPLNYRLGAEQLAALMAAHPAALVLGDDPAAGDASRGEATLGLDDFLAEVGAEGGAASALPAGSPATSDDVAVILYTSGTTGAPKAALLRHRHLTSYVFGTVEFAGAAEEEAALVAVPPYHIAGLANLLSNLYAGRRIVYLETFEPEAWLRTVRSEQVTQAMLVPTMLARLVRHLGTVGDASVPTLRTLAYGGSRMPVPVLEEALARFPDTGFVGAYGLTETSSTIALLSPSDHQAALRSGGDRARARLASVGRPVPGVEVEVRGEAGAPNGPEEPGLVFLRGDQVSGEYGGASSLDAGGWFPTGDRGWMDGEGYLFIEGRADDTIIRGGENVAPAEIEDVLVSHPAVSDAAVVGVPDDEWGQRIAAVVCPAEAGAVTPSELQDWVRSHLRSSKTPDVVVFRPDLARTSTGKLLRREILADLEAALVPPDDRPGPAGAR